MKEFKTNVEKEVSENNFYRKVLFTANKMQLVAMSLNPKEDIPAEIHKNVDQFIRVESGKASAEVNGKKYILNDGDAIIIPMGKKHRIANISNKKLKLYSIYATPEHPKGTVHKTQQEAEAAED